MKRYALALLTITTLFGLHACSNGRIPSEPEPEADIASMRVSANVSGTLISTLVITVDAADIDPALAFNLEVVDGTAQGTLEVPVGSDRTFTGQGFDTGGQVTHEGSETVNVSAGSNPPLSIPLVPIRGEVGVTLEVGDYSVVVDPASASVEVGQTQQLTVTVTAPDGSVVNEPAAWATLNPATATVDTDGLVSAAAEGTVDIVASYGGVAGKSVITVGAPSGSLTTYYEDVDNDGFGNPNSSTEAETQPTGYVLDDTDCDDDNADVHPGATEVDGNGIDDDCDGQIDEGSTFEDADGDGYGTDTDCNDADGTVFPGATELADGQDNDCDGVIPGDEIDDDGDGYIEARIDSGGWDGPSGVVGGGDCDDADAAVNPSAPEVMNGIDDDCDGDIDEDAVDA